MPGSRLTIMSRDVVKVAGGDTNNNRWGSAEQPADIKHTTEQTANTEHTAEHTAEVCSTQPWPDCPMLGVDNRQQILRPAAVSRPEQT